MAFAAFYDANVLIPHEIRDVLMIAASTRLFAPYWSDDVFEEWLANSVEKNLAPKETVLRFQSMMNEMHPSALITRNRYENLIDAMTNDYKDRHVLAAAVIADADVIVSADTDGFPKDSVEPYSIEVQTADEFARTQAALSPGLFLEQFLRRAAERNWLSINRGDGPLSAEEIAMFLRDGPSQMPQTGQFLLDLLT